MKTTITILFTLTLSFISFKSMTYSGGPDPGLTNAPGETNCTNCHNPSGSPVPTVTAGTTWNAMNLSVAGATLGTLVENTTYTLNLTFADPTSIKYGFQLCVLPAGANGSTPSLGTLISATPETQIQSGGGRDYLEHTSSGYDAPTNTKTWTFEWTTPPSYNGGATFYVVVNSTNSSSGADGGDIIYTKTFAVNVAMPVSWLYAKALRNNDDVDINWATASEKNNWKFVVEKSRDSKNWEAIGEVEAKGNTAMVSKYSFNDKATANEAAIYRIKQIDFDGKYSYSVLMNAGGKLDIAKPRLYYNTEKMGYVVTGNQIKNIDIIDLNGAVRQIPLASTSECEIPLLTKGLYIIQITTETEMYYEKMLVN